MKLIIILMAQAVQWCCNDSPFPRLKTGLARVESDDYEESHHRAKRAKRHRYPSLLNFHKDLPGESFPNDLRC